MKHHHPARARKRRAPDEAAAPNAEHGEAAASQAQSLETLRNSQVSPTQRAEALAGLQRVVGNAQVERELAQRQDSSEPAQAPFDLPRLRLDLLDLVDVASVSLFDPKLPAPLRRRSPLPDITRPKKVVRWKLKLELDVLKDSPAAQVFAEGERLQSLMSMGRAVEASAETPLVLRAINEAVSWLPPTAIDRFLETVHVKHLDLIADPSKANYGASILLEFEF